MDPSWDLPRFPGHLKTKGRVAMCRCATALLSDVDPAEAAAKLLEGKGARTNRFGFT